MLVKLTTDKENEQKMNWNICSLFFSIERIGKIRKNEDKCWIIFFLVLSWLRFDKKLYCAKRLPWGWGGKKKQKYVSIPKVSLSRSPSFSLSLSLTHSLTLFLSLTHSLTHSLSLSLTHSLSFCSLFHEISINVVISLELEKRIIT